MLETCATSTKGMVMRSCFAVFLLSTICKAQGTACNIPPVQIGQAATLTCHYNEDVLKFRQKIIIMHYRSPDDENPETVLFSTIFNGMVEYYLHPDYVLLTKNDVIQVQIPRVAKKHAGRYACLVLPSNSINECSFTPIDSSKLGHANLSNNTNTDSNDRRDATYNSKSYNDYKMIISVTGGFLALLTCIAIGAVSYRICTTRNNKRNVENEEKDEEEGRGEGEKIEACVNPLDSCKEQEDTENSEISLISQTSKVSSTTAESWGFPVNNNISLIDKKCVRSEIMNG